MTIAIIIILVLTVSALVYLYVEGKKQVERMNKKIEDINNKNEGIHEKIDILQNSLKEKQKAHKKLSEEINQLKDELKKKTALENYAKTKKELKEVQPEKIYFVKPIDNSFPVELQTTEVQGTVYEVSIDYGSNTATYAVHTAGANVSEIIRRSEMYLKPGCIEQNFPDMETIHIITETPGTLALEDNKWVIKSKAIIRYE